MTAMTTKGGVILDTLHTVLRTIRTETKSGKDHLNVFRESLAYLDQLQRKAPPRRKQAKRATAG
jgi:hypothetical protein